MGAGRQGAGVLRTGIRPKDKEAEGGKGLDVEHVCRGIMRGGLELAVQARSG